MSISDWIAAFALVPVGLLVADRVRVWWGRRGIDVWLANHAERLAAAERLDAVGEVDRARAERRSADRELAARLVADEIADSLIARHKAPFRAIGWAYLVLASGYFVSILGSWLIGSQIPWSVHLVVCAVLLGAASWWSRYTRADRKTLRRRAERIVMYRRVRATPVS